ncbi:hypothetical protein M422DRAFT_252729 [Sphaerobolus stellatus SS14]|uniref:F-box domain-containing protein n=1 Tax=Sphaerobolus stellatus (strain SS14) TaxID=990650 RepID=A0A0C9VP28_SPHS4|nr:hypothetical protein M422DRAFT_252729 [Sphaerobolus stellatus SS14]
MALANLPKELLEYIFNNIDEVGDLLSLALACRILKEETMANPNHQLSFGRQDSKLGVFCGPDLKVIPRSLSRVPGYTEDAGPFEPYTLPLSFGSRRSLYHTSISLVLLRSPNRECLCP